MGDFLTILNALRTQIRSFAETLGVAEGMPLDAQSAERCLNPARSTWLAIYEFSTRQGMYPPAVGDEFVRGLLRLQTLLSQSADAEPHLAETAEYLSLMALLQTQGNEAVRRRISELLDRPKPGSVPRPGTRVAPSGPNGHRQDSPCITSTIERTNG